MTATSPTWDATVSAASSRLRLKTSWLVGPRGVGSLGEGGESPPLMQLTVCDWSYNCAARTRIANGTGVSSTLTCVWPHVSLCRGCSRMLSKPRIEPRTRPHTVCPLPHSGWPFSAMKKSGPSPWDNPWMARQMAGALGMAGTISSSFMSGVCPYGARTDEARVTSLDQRRALPGNGHKARGGQRALHQCIWRTRPAIIVDGARRGNGLRPVEAARGACIRIASRTGAGEALHVCGRDWRDVVP